MMTLSSAPTLMPSSAETSGMAPALMKAPTSPERQEPRVEEAAGQDQSRDADRDIRHAGKGFDHAERRGVEPCSRIRQKQQHDSGGDDRAALEPATGGQVTVDDDIGAEREDHRQQDPGAGRHDLAGGPAPTFLRFPRGSVVLLEKQADAGRDHEKHGNLAQRIEAAVGDEDPGDDVGDTEFGGGLRHVMLRKRTQGRPFRIAAWPGGRRSARTG